MRKAVRLAVVPVLTLLLTGCNQIKSAETLYDARCLLIQALVMNQQVAAAPNDSVAIARTYGTMLYYIGRMQGRDPNVNISDRIRAETPNMTPEEISTVGPNCAKDLATLGQQLQNMSRDFEKLPNPSRPR
jgi:hypothetical protein